MKINFNLINTKTKFSANQKVNNKKQSQQLTTFTPLYVDRLFGNQDELSIKKAIEQHNKAANQTDPIINSRKNTKKNKNILLNRANQINSTTPAIDLEKIKAIALPEKEKSKLRPFEKSHKLYTLDKYQEDSIDSYISGNTTVTTAPTGTGKTLIAEYCINDALNKGKKIAYLSPLKALSNEKFGDFCELFGQYIDGEFQNSDNVGILTGEVAINPEAPLIIMTTEVYRNMVNSEDEDSINDTFKDFSGVIIDEFQYLNDPERGTVWEEAVMQTPKHMQLLLLTATAKNANQVQTWLAKLNPSINVNLIDVPEDERYVPLKEYVFGYTPGGNMIKPIYDNVINVPKLQNHHSDRAKKAIAELEELFDGQNYLEILAQFQDEKGRINAEQFSQELAQMKDINIEKAQQIAYVLSDKDSKIGVNNVGLNYAYKNPPLTALTKILANKKMTPALFFVFSKKKCKKEMDEVSSKLGTLLTPEESKRVLDVVNEAKEKGIYLGIDFDTEYLPKLLMGYAVHHAGMLPSYKSLIEKLSREGLIKACYATETLLAGINMPFKTTVFTSLEKFNGKRNIELPVINYKQGAGRAGRRGIDEIGNVIVCPTSNYEYERFKEIMESDDTKIESAFNLSYASLLQNNAIKNLDRFISDSFYVHQNGNFNQLKEKAIAKLNYLEEKGYLIREKGKYLVTQKGNIAKKVYGINQVLFCELISDPKYTKDLTPEELAACMTMFADINDDRPRETFEEDLTETAQKLSSIIDLAKQIKTEQAQHKIDEEIKLSTNLVPAVLKFAYMPKSTKEEYIDLWKQIFEELKSSYTIMHEGDLLRVFNGTLDLLQTIVDVSDNQELVNKAKFAIESLKKPPLTDILEYELNIK